MNFEEEIFGDERLVDPAPTSRDLVQANNLRPKRLVDYIGQEQVKANLAILLAAALQ